MYLILLSLILLATASVIMAYFDVKKKLYQNSILPNQIRLVHALILELQNACLWLEFTNKKGEETFIELNFFEIASFIENKHLLSKEKFDDYKLVFADNVNQLIHFDLFLNDPLLPKEINEELLNFCNKKYSTATTIGSDYFKLYIPENNLYLRTIFPYKFYEGNGEAFECWLNFKECSHSLLFVIKQWMNTHSRDFEFQKNNSTQKELTPLY